MGGKGRNRDYIDSILNSEDRSKSSQKAILDELVSVYNTSIKPLEEAYKFSYSEYKHQPVAEIYAKPSLLVLGPLSSGKTSMINYILGLEGREALRTETEPNSSDFVIIDHGPKRKTLTSTLLLSDESRPYKPLKHYGMGLAARLHGRELPVKSLQHLTVIDTPGIMVNADQQKQGYAYMEVCHWFIRRAALIFLVFDPTKLEAGKQLRQMLQRLRGHESKLRIIFNKADNFDPVSLLRAYGSFCWTLKSMMPFSPEPPRIHLVSCCFETFKVTAFKDFFVTEEKELVQDIKEAIDNHSEAVISSLLSHALSVETHAIIVDAYLYAYDSHRYRWLMWKNDALQSDVVDCPDLFDIPQAVGEKTSNHDGYLNVLNYRRFFQKHPLSSFYRASQSRFGVFISGDTVLERAQKAIRTTFPKLLLKQRSVRTKAIGEDTWKGQNANATIISNTLERLKNTGQHLKELLVKDDVKEGKNMISNTICIFKATGQQLKEALVNHPIAATWWISSPIDILAQKINTNSALKS